MFEEIERFYESTKVRKLATVGGDGEVPITHLQVFHKRYPRLPRVALPPVDAGGELSELLGRRRSSREYSGEAIRLGELSEILDSCRIVESAGPLERRTYPSAGARFPVEVYPVAFDVEGLEAGCYHYAMRDSELELLWEQDLRERQGEFLSPAISGAAVALVFTSVIARAEVKYGARAYPFSMLEAGHMAQNVSLVCTRMGLGSCAIGGYVNDFVSSCLDLTRDEIPVYVMAIGREAV